MLSDTSLRDLTARVQKSIDTGFGWSYVIDTVTVSAREVAVEYHVEGNTDGLSPVPMRPPAPDAVVAMLPPNPGQTRVTRIDVTPGMQSVTVYFGAAGRPIPARATVAFERTADGWAPGVIEVAGGRYPAQIVTGVQQGRQVVSVAVTSDVVLLGAGATGHDDILEYGWGACLQAHRREFVAASQRLQMGL